MIVRSTSLNQHAYYSLGVKTFCAFGMVTTTLHIISKIKSIIFFASGLRSYTHARTCPHQVVCVQEIRNLRFVALLNS